jgi:hypothetical protein
MYSIYYRGLLVDYRGWKSNSTATQQLLLPLQETMALPFNQGIKGIEDYFKRKRGPSPTVHEAAFRKSKNLINADFNLNHLSETLKFAIIIRAYRCNPKYLSLHAL